MLQVNHLKLIFGEKSATELFPLVPVTAIMFFGFSLKNLEQTFFNKSLMLLVLIILEFPLIFFVETIAQAPFLRA